MTKRTAIYWDTYPSNHCWAYVHESLGVTERGVLESLDQLLAVLRLGGDVHTRTSNGHPSGMDNLPAFGGEAPDDTSGVWSWDATRLLVGTCADDFEIVDRPTTTKTMCGNCGRTFTPERRALMRAEGPHAVVATAPITEATTLSELEGKLGQRALHIDITRDGYAAEILEYKHGWAVELPPRAIASGEGSTIAAAINSAFGEL